MVLSEAIGFQHDSRIDSMRLSEDNTMNPSFVICK